MLFVFYLQLQIYSWCQRDGFKHLKILLIKKNSIFSLKKRSFSKKKMANFHSRSNSFPSKSHPAMENIEDHLCRLKGSETTSTSATSICSNLASLIYLQEGINNLIQMPSTQKVLSHKHGENWTNEMLDRSLGLVDLCGLSREIVSLTKESVQQLESSIRRNRGETATADDINSYMASRKNINKMVNKCIKNLKIFNQNSTAVLEKEENLKAIIIVLKETDALAFSILKSALILVSGEKGRSKQRNWSLISKFNQTNSVHSQTEQESDLRALNIDVSRKGMDKNAMQIVLKQLKASETTIQDLEDGLES